MQTEVLAGTESISGAVARACNALACGQARVNFSSDTSRYLAYIGAASVFVEDPRSSGVVGEAEESADGELMFNIFEFVGRQIGGTSVSLAGFLLYPELPSSSNRRARAGQRRQACFDRAPVAPIHT